MNLEIFVILARYATLAQRGLGELGLMCVVVMFCVRVRVGLNLDHAPPRARHERLQLGSISAEERGSFPFFFAFLLHIYIK